MGQGVTQNLDILAVDDDVGFCEALRALLADDYDIRAAHTASDALSTISRGGVNLVLLDIQLPDLSGLDVLKRIRAQNSQLPVIMLTGNADIRTAIFAMKLGASDYVIKGTHGFEDELRARIEQVERHLTLLDHSVKLEQRLTEHASQYQLVGSSIPITKLRSQIAALRGRETSIVLTGESGVGKEVIARNLHYQDGLQRPFVGVNCGAIPENLLESELFGHERGAFTGAIQKKVGKFFLANGGTIFLDEIGDMPLQMQVKILRALQERIISPVGATKSIPIQVRVITATNKDLARGVREGRFREDLYYRLSVITLHIPPLRERFEDIPELVKHFLDENRAGAIRVSEEALNLLKRHRWPGNIRQLRNCIERALVEIDDKGSYEIKPEHLFLDDVSAKAGSSVSIPGHLLPETGDDLNDTSLETFTTWAEQVFFDRAFFAAQRNKTRLAEKLGLSRDFLHRKLKSLGIGSMSCAQESETEAMQ